MENRKHFQAGLASPHNGITIQKELYGKKPITVIGL
jgi:hypothetical protein